MDKGSYLTISLISKILGISEQAVHKRAIKEQWKFKEIVDNRGKPKRCYSLNDLPLDIQNAVKLKDLKAYTGEPFSPETILDLSKSGLNKEIIREAKLLPATKEYLDKYKIHYFDKKRREERFKPLYIIPYQVLSTDQDRFCRVKVLPTKPHLFEGKYTQPQKQFLKNTCHLYILPSEMEKSKSNKAKIAIVEGEKKALKLIQEIRKIEDELGFKIAVIGISGINNWQTAPEWKELNLLNKEIITFFDADSEHNSAVIEAEIELAGFLISKGVAYVTSAVWSISEGKGIDDFLVNAKDKQFEKLKTLIQSRINIFAKAKGKIQDRTLIRKFFKHLLYVDKTTLDYASNILKEESKIGKKVIDTELKILKKQRERELKERLKEEIRDKFNVESIEIPSDFIWEEGYLKTQDKDILLEFFIVKENIVDEKGKHTGIVLKFVNGKEIEVDIEQLNKKTLTYLLNINGIRTDEITTQKVLRYITLYSKLNKIPKREKIRTIGWIDDKYLLPQVNPDLKFDEDIEEEYKAKGSREKELQLMKKVFAKGKYLGLGYVFAFASTLLSPLNISNFVIFNQGLTGSGKTTTNLIGLSVFGDYTKLKRNLNTTSVGLEILLSTRKDTLILLDEVNTANKDVAKQLTKIIYDFESAKGRTRANKDLNLKEVYTYRGILSISSEDSLKNLLQETNKTTKGAYRRTIIVDFGEFEKIDREIIKEVYATITRNYGNLIKEWIEYVKKNIDKIAELYAFYVDDLESEEKGLNFNGQQRYFALLLTTLELMGDVFNVSIDKLSQVIWKIIGLNNMEFEEEISLTKEKISNKLEIFIQENISNFAFYSLTEEGILLEKNIPKKYFYGLLKEEDEKNTVYLTSTGMQAFCKYLHFPEKEVKKILVEFGFAEEGGGETIIKRVKTPSIAGNRYNTYKITY